MQTVINVERLSKSYNNLFAADNISLSVKRGSVYGLLGANGAGKSTVMECILGTKNADSGTVSVLGYHPKKDRKRLFQNVGVQFQEGGYQPEIKVSELCEETACLYKTPADCPPLEPVGNSDRLKTHPIHLLHRCGRYALQCCFRMYGTTPPSVAVSAKLSRLQTGILLL